MAAASSLELTLRPGRLACAGVLNRRNRHHVLEAVDVLLGGRPLPLVVDISALSIEDVDGANTLVHVQRAVREAGATVSWQGLDSSRLKGILPFQATSPRHRPRRSPRGECL